MVLPVVAAAHAASAAGSAAATGLGLGMGKTDLDLTRELFKLQMRQAKRLWAADWAEASVRHGEQCMQSAQQHAESQAMASAAYFQAEKLTLQGIKLARDQDSRSYEMVWRAEVRESLRDELANQYNRFNTVMLCDTVCLSCVFSLVAESGLPVETPKIMISLYVLSMGVTIMLFTISLWFAVMVVRRLHEHTAAILERKLFAYSEDLQKRWQDQLALNLPTGAQEINLVNQAYEKWVAQHLTPIGEPSIHMMAIGIVMLFVTAGLLTHNLYLIQYNSLAAVIIFWSTVLITSTTVLFMKYAEDRREKKKLGVYDNSWQDQSTLETGPFAKIIRAAQSLFSAKAMEMGSMDRMESLDEHERKERDFCAKTKSLHHGVKSLREEAKQRAKTRKDVLQLLTTAAEELDSLPEELTSQLNKLLHEIDEADNRTADFIAMQTEADNTLEIQGSSKLGWSRLPSILSSPRQPMKAQPIDAQRIPVSLSSLRNKLGESSITTLLRFRNLSDEPLRLKHGVQLKEGQYIRSLKATDPSDNSVCLQLYPSSEIPPRSEVVVAARNNGKWVATSGIQGEICYTNREETWLFRIKFSNELLRKVRNCEVRATHVGDDETKDAFWTISKEELDIKSNNEVVIKMDVKRGEQGRQAAISYRQSQRTLKDGFLLKQKRFGVGLNWQRRWVSLTPTEIVYSDKAGSAKQSKIALKNITGVWKVSDTDVFEICTGTSTGSNFLYRFSAASPIERDDWIQSIMDATGIDVTTKNLSSEESSETNTHSSQSVMEDGFECVPSDTGTSVLPI